MHLKNNISLKNLNTFGLEAVAKYYVEVSTISELKEALDSEIAKTNKLMILGGGSNLLFTQDFDGLVIKNNISGKTVARETEHCVLLKLGAGENWHDVVLYTIGRGYGGIENLSLIPGTVGAAPMQNIGAYGVEIKDVFDHLLAVNIETNEVEEFKKEQCLFGYRESIFKRKLKDKYVIAEVVLKLTKKAHQLNTSYGAISETLQEMKVKAPTLEDISKAVIKIRQSKLPDPAKIGNAGSFFKNPTVDKLQFEALRAEYKNMPGYELPDNMIKIPAGWLIEQCGWKGFKKGDIGVHKNQALVLVNYGTGKGKDLKHLAEQIKTSVVKKFGIELTAEVNMV